MTPGSNPSLYHIFGLFFIKCFPVRPRDTVRVRVRVRVRFDHHNCITSYLNSFAVIMTDGMNKQTAGILTVTLIFYLKWHTKTYQGRRTLSVTELHCVIFTSSPYRK